MKLIPNKDNIAKVQNYMAASIAPRPVALASTVNAEGLPNLSPFSFYNSFGVNPPILVFSPSRRSRDNSIKHSLINVREVPEVVINTVQYNMVHQVNLSSTEYPDGINEFEKSGLTPIESELVKPFRVKESLVQFECKVLDIVETGKFGGAGNLVICEILLIHVNESCLNEKGKIDYDKLDLVGRMGENYYCRTSGNSVFEVEKPLTSLGLGVDLLPFEIRNSEVLTGSDLGRLGNIEKMPSQAEVEEFKKNQICSHLQNRVNSELLSAKHRLAKKLIGDDRVYDALKVLLM